MLKIEKSEESICHKNIPTKKKKPKDKHASAIKPYIKERQSSKRDPTYVHSTLFDSKASKSNSYLVQESSHFGSMYTELTTLKNQYKELRSSYNGLLKDKNELSTREGKEITEANRKVEKAKTQIEKYKNKVTFLTNQIQRIKKESIKLLEVQKHRNIKLQQTLQEKQLMIAYLRNKLGGNSNPFHLQHTAPSFLQDAHVSEKMQNKSIQEEDSLSLSQDKSKIFDSILSEDPLVLTFTKKDIVILDEQTQDKQNKEQQNILTFENRCKLPESLCSLPPHPIKKSQESHKKMGKKKMKITETERIEDSKERKIKKKRSSRKKIF